MRILFPFFLGIWVQSTGGFAQTAITSSVPVERQLSGLNAAEADALVAKLRAAQRRLKGGERLTFQLLTGSIAYYEATNIPPRTAFLDLSFDMVWSIIRVSPTNPGWQPYKLAYAPAGLGKHYWDIEIVIGFNGNIERVLMLYKPPAPS